ncbi:hypothetical protein TNCV_4966501 [Trichonephila clavipes]|nr:hypothetical protein TNCV_4966501 [Trichonephila clavipes]
MEVSHFETINAFLRGRKMFFYPIDNHQPLNWFARASYGLSKVDYNQFARTLYGHLYFLPVFDLDILLTLISPGSCAFRSLDSQNDWGRVEFESHHRSSDFDQWIEDEKDLRQNGSENPVTQQFQ